MSLIGWLLGGKGNDDDASDFEDTEEDVAWIGPLATRREQECKADPSDYGQGQAEARFQIDDMRRYYHQYGYGSFQEALETTGTYWHEKTMQEQSLIDQGHTERQGHLDFARGNRSLYD